MKIRWLAADGTVKLIFDNVETLRMCECRPEVVSIWDSEPIIISIVQLAPGEALVRERATLDEEEVMAEYPP